MVLGVLACEDNSEDTRPFVHEVYDENCVELRDIIRSNTDPDTIGPGGGGGDTLKVY
tara:strand:- start:45 stop:215 length:171 start_codon:yes stop_codon:yes gene_type:complete